MKVRMLEISEVIPYERNPRRNEKAVDLVAASIREYGWRQPIVVDADGVIIVGHTRFLAAKKLGLKKVPVHVAEDLTPAQVKTYRIADNKLAEAAEWDEELLKLEFQDLQLEVDLQLTGFSDDEIGRLLKEAIEHDTQHSAGAVEPPRRKKVEPKATAQGDVYQIGEHRLYCRGPEVSTDGVDVLEKMIEAERQGRVCYVFNAQPEDCEMILAAMRAEFPDLQIRRNGEEFEP